MLPPTVLLNKLLDGGGYPLYFRIAHIRIDRQGDAAHECILRMREIARAVPIVIPIIGMQVKRNEMNTATNSSLL